MLLRKHFLNIIFHEFPSCGELETLNKIMTFTSLGFRHAIHALQLSHLTILKIHVFFGKVVKIMICWKSNFPRNNFLRLTVGLKVVILLQIFADFSVWRVRLTTVPRKALSDELGIFIILKADYFHLWFLLQKM